MKKKIGFAYLALLLSVLYFAPHRDITAVKPADFRDAPAEVSALESLQQTSGAFQTLELLPAPQIPSLDEAAPAPQHQQTADGASSQDLRGEELTEGEPLDDPRTISSDEWGKWGRLDWERQSGNQLRFDYWGKDGTTDHQILELRHFNKQTKNLLLRLYRLSTKPKYIKRDYTQQWQDNYRTYSDLVARSPKASISQEELMAKVKEETKKSEGVEIGAWRITYTNGKVLTAIHTSSLNGRVNTDDFNLAFKEVINSYGQPLKTISMVQYFHTHPSPGVPLSRGDYGVYKAIADSLSNMGLSIPVHIYAITKLEDKFFIAHAGKRS